MYLNLVALLLCTIAAKAAVDYVVVFEKVRVIWFNPDYFKDVICNYRIFNRTAFIVNSHFVTLKPINYDIVKGSAKLYIYFQNEYHQQPMKLSRRICSEYKKGTYSDWKEMEKYGNMSGCGLQPKGYYVISNYTPVFQLPELPLKRGKYKVTIDGEIAKVSLVKIAYYVSIENL